MVAPNQASASQINRAYYSQVLDGMDDYWRKMAAPRFRVRTLLSLLSASQTLGSPTRLIDLGCGNAQLLSEIAARFPGFQLCGVDLAEPQLAINRTRMPACQFVCLDLSQPDVIPAELHGRFDLVTASEVIEHLDDPAQLLRTARTLCRPKGKLLLSTQSGTVHQTERRVGHLRHFAAEQMAQLLRDTGFSVVRVWNCGFPFHDLSKWYANRDPDRSLNEFAGKRYGLKQDLLCLLLRAAFRLNSRTRGAQLFAVAERPAD